MMPGGLAPTLIQDVLAGDPSAAAELQRLREHDVLRQFQGSRGGVLRSLLGRALLGRSRAPSGALTREEERLLEETRPELRYESAASSPHRTYPVSRLLTQPAIAALPAAGAAAGLGYLAASQTDLPAWAKSLITAGSAGLGGVAGSTAAHALRQHHARSLRRESPEPKTAGVLDSIIRGVGEAAPAAARAVEQFAPTILRGAETVAPATVRALAPAAEQVTGALAPVLARGEATAAGMAHMAPAPPAIAAPALGSEVIPLGSSIPGAAGVHSLWPQPTLASEASLFGTLREAPMGFRETVTRLQRGMPLLPMDVHNLQWMRDIQPVLARASVLRDVIGRADPALRSIALEDMARLQETAGSLGVRSLMPRAQSFMDELGRKLGAARLPLWSSAAQYLDKIADEVPGVQSLIHQTVPEPEDVRKLRRLRDFLSRLFRRSRSARALSAVNDLITEGQS